MELKEIIAQFSHGETVVSVKPFGSGRINDTFCAACESGARLILQRINHNVFRNVPALMDNIVGVTQYLAARKPDPEKCLRFVPLKEGGACWYKDDAGNFWRVYRFVEKTVTLETIETPAQFEQAGRAFGGFQKDLAEYPSETLVETIPDYHNTPARYRAFAAAVETDACGRCAEAAEEIAALQARAARCSLLTDLLEAGKMPLRVTHNDTKINNVLLDEVTFEPVCVIDLATVMPGLSLYDFGDCIRSGANRAGEDERDTSLISCDLELFEAFTRGYLAACGAALTEQEIALLPESVEIMTLELSLRFLADFLAGDVYFRVQEPDHNLVRARDQLALLFDIEKKLPAMHAIVDKVLGR